MKDLSASLEAMSAVTALAPYLACGEEPLSPLGGDVRGGALAPSLAQVGDHEHSSGVCPEVGDHEHSFGVVLR